MTTRPPTLVRDLDAAPGAAPVSDTEFAELMTPFEPFEPAPRVAVGVSGGPDSLALTFLMDAWVRARGGSVLGLTLDHGLRPEAAEEARWVGTVLNGRDIPHETLRWQAPKPDKVRQERAREERYDRLRARCAEHGILHLAIGHHREDRAETVLLRLRAGSGLDGLAGMAHEREMPELRLIRPLLTLPKARLIATLRARCQAWIEDPTNRRPDQLRVRIRGLMPGLADEGLSAARINEIAGLIGRTRGVLEQAQDALMARSVTLHPAGFAWVDPAAIGDVPAQVARGVLSRVLLAVGGQVYPPRAARLERLYACLREGLGRGCTLGGCRVVPRRGCWLVLREAGRSPRFALRAGETLVYDGRYELTLALAAPAALEIGPLGRDGWSALTALAPQLRKTALPPAVRPALPALFDSEGVREVPALGWLRPNAETVLRSWRFAPRRALSGGGFTVAQ